MDKVYFPSEWDRQSAIQLTWPHEESDWAYMLDEITICFVEIAHEVLKRQALIIVCKNASSVIDQLGENKYPDRLKLVEINSNDTWARDHGGITVFVDNVPIVYDFTFNGWGLKFAANFDNLINRELFDKKIFSPDVKFCNKKDFVLEGGSVESDGKGTILTTSECLLSPNRNAFLSKDQISDYLKLTFGVKKVLWLDHGYLSGDDTDSHIDTLARFCDENTIAYVKCEDPSDEHYEALKNMEEQLKIFTNYKGDPYKLIPLPLPKSIFDEDGTRLPATYANFLIMNDVVLLPVYDDNAENNEIARRQLSEVFGEREIISVNCTPIIKQHGSLHCITMQYPENVIDFC